ncbi:metallophosphoesterase family protein [Thomasclavelia sp.]
MIKVGIISDTHNFLREEVINELQTCDYIIHGGDIVDKKILDKLKSISKVFVVKGNNDNLDLNKDVYFQIGSYTFYMIHELGEKKDVDFYIYGHSHQPACYNKGKTLYINPGSCGKKRFSLPLTYIILYLYEDYYELTLKKCHL